MPNLAREVNTELQQQSSTMLVLNNKITSLYFCTEESRPCSLGLTRSEVLPRNKGTLKVFLNLCKSRDIIQKVAVTGQDLSHLRTDIIRHDKRKYVKNSGVHYSIVSHPDENKRIRFVFCVVTHSLFPPSHLRPVTFARRLSPSLHISVHIPWKAFHA